MTPPSDDETPTVSEEVDDVASEVIDRLGPECKGFDFYYKSELGTGEYRPVQCGLDTRYPRSAYSASASPSPSPSPTPGTDRPKRLLVRGPRLNIFAFSDTKTKVAWLRSHDAPWRGRIRGENWVVDVMDRGAFGEIVDELGGPSDSFTVVFPRATWHVAGRVVEDLPRDYEPPVSLRRASRRLAMNAEILAAHLGSYRGGAVPDPIPAWIVVMRKCVPSYGGAHASESCSGDRRYVVIDARSGRRVDSFST